MIRILQITITVFSLLLVTSGLYAQDDVTSAEYDPVANPSDTFFKEIILDDEGVIAYDSLDNVWYYNFEEGVFVFEGRELGTEHRYFEDSGEDDYLPVEERCVVKRKLKSLVNKVTIGEDEYVEGDIIAIGRVTVKGWVQGDIKSINGRVMVTASGQVDGDIEAPRIIVKDGGMVVGEEIISDTPLDFKDITETFNIDGILVISILTISFVLVGFLVLSIMPRQYANLNSCIEANKVKTTLLGFLMFIAMPFVLGLVAITIIGVVLVPFIPVLYIFAAIMGMLSFGGRIGKKITTRFTGEKKDSMFQSLVGLVSLMMLWFLSMFFFGMGGDAGPALGGVTLAAAIIFTFYPFFSGIGAAFLTRFGFRVYVSWRDRVREERPSQTPEPPPIPQPPNGFSPGGRPPQPPPVSPDPPEKSE